MEFTPHRYGQYLLLQRLASGGMSEVYRGIASGAGKFHKQVAIKRILPDFSQDEEFERRFEYEAHLASRLSHSNIVEVYDFVKLNETYLLAMEFVEGRNVRQLLKKLKAEDRPERTPLALWLISEVCKGLEYAHTRKDPMNGEPWNIIHRDISPENIMVSFEGDVKIVDFGIARARDWAQVTQPDVIRGKLGYLSPEYATGNSVDHRSDIFSAGLVLYELLTGKKCFPDQKLDLALKQIESCQIALPSTIRPEIGNELEALVMKAIARSPDDRFRSAGELGRGLQMYLNAYHPSFLQKDVADFMETIFSSEREAGRREWEAACKKAAALTLAELESSIGLEARPMVSRTAGVSAASALPKPPLGPGELLRKALAEAAVASASPEAAGDVGTPASVEPSLHLLRAPDGVESLFHEKTNLTESLPMAPDVEVPQKPSPGASDAPARTPAMGMPFAERAEPSLSQTATTELSVVTPASPEPLPTSPSVAPPADSVEPSLNLLPASAASAPPEVTTDVPKSATATSAAIERGKEVPPPPAPEPPPVRREPVQELGRYLAIGSMVGLLSLFLIHRWGKAHRTVAEVEPALPAVSEPVETAPEMKGDPLSAGTPSEEEPDLPIPPPEPQPEPVAPVPTPAPSRAHRRVAKRATGKVAFHTDKTVTLYVDGHLRGRIRANQTVTLALATGRPHKLRFLSAPNGIDATRTVKVTPRKVVRKAYTLQAMAHRKTNRRPAAAH